MKILYIGDNRNRVNWGCRATSKALQTLILKNNNVLIGTVDGKETHSTFTKIEYNRKLPVKWFQRIEYRKNKFLFSRLYRILSARKFANDFLTPDIDQSIDFFLKNNIHYPTLKKISDELQMCDSIVINGEGTMIFTTPPRRDTLFYLFMLKIGQKLGKKTFLLNAMISDCPKTGRNIDTAKLTVDIFSNCQAVTLRDPFSYRILNELDKNNTITKEFVPDALFTWRKYFQSDDVKPPVIGDSIIPWPEEDKYFGRFDFSNPYICVSGSSAAAWTQKEAVNGYVDLIEKLKELQIKIYLVPTCSGDIFLERVSEITNTPLLPVNISIINGATILANAELFISGRFHPSILASLGGTRCVFLGSNSHKNESLQEMLGYKEIMEYSSIPTFEDINRIFEKASAFLCDTQQKVEERTRIKNKVDDLMKKSLTISKFFNL